MHTDLPDVPDRFDGFPLIVRDPGIHAPLYVIAHLNNVKGIEAQVIRQARIDVHLGTVDLVILTKDVEDAVLNLISRPGCTCPPITDRVGQGFGLGGGKFP